MARCVDLLNNGCYKCVSQTEADGLYRLQLLRVTTTVLFSKKKERGYENVINIQIYAGSCGAPDDGVARCCCFVFVGSDGDRPDKI